MSSRHLVRQALVIAVTVALACTFAGRPAAARAADTSVGRGLDYLHACQNSDGGFAEKGAASSDAQTAWAMVAIAAAGENSDAWTRGGKTPAEFLAGQSSHWKATTDLARTTLAVVAAGKNPRSFGGIDLVGAMQAQVQDRAADGDQIGPYVNSHAWAMLALRAAGVTVTDREIHWLLSQQGSDGGWGWAPGVASDTNDTAAAVQALVAVGQSPSSAGMTRALSYLRARQTADGGFAYAGGSASDADSTAWVTQALVAAGQDLASWRRGGTGPAERLRALQSADGSVRYSASQVTNPMLVTAQVIPAFAARACPVAHPSPAKTPSPWLPSMTAEWPAPGATVAWPSGSTLRFTLADAAGTGVAPSGVSVRVDGAAKSPAVSGTAVTVSAGALTTGTHSATVVLTDRAGNVATAATWTFTVVPPGVAAPVATTASAAKAAAAAATAAGVPSGMSAGPGAPSAATAAGGPESGDSSTKPVAAEAAGAASGAPFGPGSAASGASRVGLVVSAIGVLVALAIGLALAVLRVRGRL